MYRGPEETSCTDTGFHSSHCSDKPVGHPHHRCPYGCGRVACGQSICQAKVVRRRMRQAMGRFGSFDNVFHVVLNVPADFRQQIRDLTAFRAEGRSVVVKWLRKHYGVASDEQLFLLDVFHPCGDKTAEVFKPHGNLFIPAVALTPDFQLQRLSLQRRGLRDLCGLWAAGLCKLTGQAVPVTDALAFVGVHSEQERRFVFLRELRPFPGWVGDLDMRWAGAFGPRKWGEVRAAMGWPEAKPDKPTCTAPEPSRPGGVCGAPRKSFSALPEDDRAALLTERERTGAVTVEQWEIVADLHARTLKYCRCPDCTRGGRFAGGNASAWKALWVCANFARYVALHNTTVFSEGGQLHAEACAIRAAYEQLGALERKNLTTAMIHQRRDVFEQFIALADEVGVAGDAKIPWRRRYEAILAEWRAHDEARTRETGELSITICLAWVHLWDPTRSRPVSSTYDVPSGRQGEGAAS